MNKKFSFWTLFFLGLLLPGLLGGFATPVSASTPANTIVSPRLDSNTDFLASTSLFTTPKTSSGEVVQVQTVPPIPGVTFQIDGKRFVSGEDGFANIQIGQPGRYRLYALIDRYHNPFQRIEFGRWVTESFKPFQDIQVPTNKVIQIGLNVYYLTGQSFVDLNGSPVNPQRIKEFSIRSTQGDLFTFHDVQPHWIPASRVARRVSGLEEVKLLYSVLDVMVDGSNAVNQSQQRFYAQPNEVWPISLILYSLRVHARDALFGFAVGESVKVEFPDGRIENYPFDQAGTAEIHSLVRGNYYVDLVGAHGLSSHLPVALSRQQEVNTRVLTYLDILIIGMFGALIMLGLLLYGRPSLLGFRLKNNQPVKSQPFF